MTSRNPLGPVHALFPVPEPANSVPGPRAKRDRAEERETALKIAGRYPRYAAALPHLKNTAEWAKPAPEPSWEK